MTLKERLDEVWNAHGCVNALYFNKWSDKRFNRFYKSKLKLWVTKGRKVIIAKRRAK